MAPHTKDTEKINKSGVTDHKVIINGGTYLLGSEVPPTTTLVQFIRDYACLTGTKVLCNEGGCGLCTVVATTNDLEKGGKKSFCIQACQTLVYSCVGWSIQTIEDLGNRFDGYNKLQTALHGFYGTQCGFCTPGFIMTMTGQQESGKELTAEAIEKSLDGNICRCTGYRPIVEAFKSFAVDAPVELVTKLKDIEEAYEATCPKTGLECANQCGKASSCGDLVFSPDYSTSVVSSQNGVSWYSPSTKQDIYNILKTKSPSDNIKICVGNTGSGVYKDDGPYNIYINTTNVKELYKIFLEPKLILGSNVSLSRCIDLFHDVAKEKKGFRHLADVARHWEIVANVAVRNTGCWAGNIMMKHKHPEFVSDIFISLVAIDAKLKVGHWDGRVLEMTPQEFLSCDMTGSLILSMEVPHQPENIIVTSYKITPRAVNAHAYVNAVLKMHVDPTDQMRVINLPAIVFGGINPSFIRAEKTEKFLLGRQLIDRETVHEAMKILRDELTPNASVHEASPQFRRSLAEGLFFKTMIKILGSSVSPTIASGALTLKRPMLKSKQTYDANEDTWPIGQALPKLESEKQISGEAEYLDDIPSLPNELFGVFVQSSVAVAKIKSIDASKSLEIEGVVDFIQAGDVPGENSFFPSPFQEGQYDKIFTGNNVQYFGQSIGLIVAKTKAIAREASKLVLIEYEEIKTPVLTVKEAIRQNRFQKNAPPGSSSTDPMAHGDVEGGFANSKFVVDGEVELGGQVHFHLEPHSARVVPIEDGFDVYSSTQWPTLTQCAVAKSLGISANSINMSVRRIGGGFGGKITRGNLTTTAAAVAAYKLRKPVRITLDLDSQITLQGGREPYYAKYKVGFNEEGIFESVSIDVYVDSGYVGNECSSPSAGQLLATIYHCPNWKVQLYNVLTDTAANSWCRSPGTTAGYAIMENILERVAHSLKKDPLEIKEKNFMSKERPQYFGSRREADNSVQASILPLMKKQADIDSRKSSIAQFNKDNRWRKRGLSVLPLRYPHEAQSFFQYNVQVAIYEQDGTVAITHGGIEMGQGINTKVAQVAAKTLNVPLEYIKIKPTNVFTGANSVVTGGCYGSDVNSHGIQKCCEKIRKRMDEVAKTMEGKNGPITWTALVKQCFAKEVDICERYFTYFKEQPSGYDIWAAACVEVDLDVLTGQFLILRADILEDCGRSLSPYVDVGQVEGAFVMGLGLYTSEEIRYDPKTGQKLSNSTWEYKPPTALDIPADFRVSFLPKGDNTAIPLRSKATGEAPLLLSYAVVTALRQAIASAREDVGDTEWFELDTPLTVEKIHKLCKVDSKDFKLM